MLDSLFRPAKDKLLSPLARRLGTVVTPNSVTIAALVVGLGACAAALYGRYPLALVLWLAGRVTDGLDGAIARQSGRQSDFGGFLDMLLDVVVYAILPIALALSEGRGSAMTMAAVLLAAFYVNIVSWSYLSAIFEKRGADAARADAAAAAESAGAGTDDTPRATSIPMPKGIIEGAETVLFFSLFLLFPAWLEYLFAAMAALTLLSAGQRLAWAVRTLKQ